MIDDPIVEEVRRVRENHAAKWNYDIAAIARDLKRKGDASGRKLSCPPAKIKTPEPRVLS